MHKCGYIRRENWLQTSSEICIEKKKKRKKEKGLTSDFQFENVDFWDGITRNKNDFSLNE